MKEWFDVITTGVHSVVVADSPVPFAYTTGLHYLLDGPEVLVIGDLPGVPAGVRAQLAGRLCWYAATHVLDAAIMLGKPHDAAKQLVHSGALLSENDVKLITWAFEQVGRSVPASVTASAAGITWRLVPLLERMIAEAAAGTMSDDKFACFNGAQFGRTRATFYVDVACCDEEALVGTPSLVCNLASSFTGDAAGQTVLEALRSLGVCTNNAACDCTTCRERRLCRAACGNAECSTQRECLSSLKKCGRCRKVAYCSAACQSADWRRHKRECVPA